jgi:hypothetical protein
MNTIPGTFTIGVWTFKPTMRIGQGGFYVKAFLGEVHVATLDAVWELDDDTFHLHREVQKAAAFWVAQEASEILSKALPICATGIL